MIRDIPITTARHELTSLPERLERDPGAVAITRRGKPVLAVMPWELYEALIETLEILGIPSSWTHCARASKRWKPARGFRGKTPRGNWVCNLRNYHHTASNGAVARNP